MSYKYEIFFSYKRDDKSNAWHEELKNIIVHWVREEADIDEVRVFFDKEEIRAGHRWKQKISQALRDSKCLVAIWSPQYFRSPYCVAEWLSFHERSRRTNKLLIAPASRCDGENFPSDAREFQFASFNKYAHTVTSFWKTDRAAEFEDQLIKPFASDVASMIRDAPDHSTDFPIVDCEADLPATTLLKERLRIRRIADE